MDNATSTGPKVIGYEDLIKLHDGRKVILELNDSTKVSGVYKGYNESRTEENKKVISIKVLNEIGGLRLVNASEINKYIYVDEGGSFWTAVAIGAAIDAVIIFSIIKSQSSFLGGTGRIF